MPLLQNHEIYLEFILKLFKVKDETTWERKVVSKFENNLGFRDVFLAGKEKMSVVKMFDDLKREQKTERELKESGNSVYLIPKSGGINDRNPIHIKDFIGCKDFFKVKCLPAEYDLYCYFEYSPCLTADLLGSVLRASETWLRGKNGTYKGTCYIGFDKFWGSDSKYFGDLRLKHGDIHKYIYMLGIMKCVETKQIDSKYEKYARLVHIDFSHIAMRKKKSNDVHFIRKLLKLSSKHAFWPTVYSYFKNSNFEKQLTTDQDVNLMFNKLIKTEIQSQTSFLFLIPKNRQFKTLLGQQTLSGFYIHGVPEHTELSVIKQADEVFKKEASSLPDQFDLYWFTFNSPCLTPSYEGGQSCIAAMLSKSEAWLYNENTKTYKGRCYIGFMRFWGFNGHPWRAFHEQNGEETLPDQIINERILNFALNNKEIYKDKFDDYATFIHIVESKDQV